MNNYFITMYQRVKRTDNIKETRKKWKTGQLFIRKNNNFCRYKGGSFDDLITLFAKEQLFTKEHFQSEKPILVCTPVYE